MVGLLHHRKHLYLSEGRLPTPLVVKGADAYKAMRPLLNGQGAICVFTMHYEGGRFDAGFLGIGNIVNVNAVPCFFRPPGVHAQQHFSPVGRVHSTSTGANIDQRFPGVVLPRQHSFDFQRFNLSTDGGTLFIGGLNAVSLFLRKFIQDGKVVEPLAQLRHTA